MRRNGLKFLIGAIVIVLALMTLNRFALGRLRTVYAPFAVERAQWFDALGQLHEFFAYAKQWRNLTEENQILKEQIQRHQSSTTTICFVGRSLSSRWRDPIRSQRGSLISA